jgi:hypothetical protein
MDKSFRLQPPPIANFIFIEAKPGLKQEGFTPGIKILISDLSESEADEYANLIRKTFLIHWANKVETKKRLK